MKNTFNWPLWHWHIEISSICPLKCSRYSRNEIPDTLVNAQLYLSVFKDNFTKNVLAYDISLHGINLNGTWILEFSGTIVRENLEKYFGLNK
jgi:hypothetical protein